MPYYALDLHALPSHDDEYSVAWRPSARTVGQYAHFSFTETN